MKVIPNFTDYSITRSGLIISFRRNPAGKYLKTPLDAKGYKVVNLYDNKGKKYNFKVHRLVLLAWVGEPPKNKTFGCHRDGNKINNELDNLYWGSPKDNQLDRIEHGTSNRGSNSSCVKLTLTQVKQIKEELKVPRKRLISDLAEKYRVSPGTIGSIKIGKTWSWV